MKVLKTEQVQSSLDVAHKLMAVRFFLKVAIAMMFVFSSINYFFFHLTNIAIAELLVGCFAIVQLIILRNQALLKIVSYITVLFCGLSIISLTLFFKLEVSTLLWVGIFPVFSFYLLGKKQGLISHILFSVTMVALVFFGFHTIPDIITPRTYVNLISYLTVSGMLIYFYEYTKSETVALLNRSSYIDQLTQLGNRKMFDEVLSKEIAQAKRHKSPLSIIMVDIDFFKKINDNYGHLIGDSVLVEFAQLLKNNIRLSDSISRWGGEEFIILLPNHTKVEADVLANKLNKTVEAFNFNKIKGFTASFGVTELLNGDTIETFLSRTDAALYQAKNNGRNQVVLI